MPSCWRRWSRSQRRSAPPGSVVRALILAALLAAGAPAMASEPPPALRIRPAPGAVPEMVFDWSRERCAETHVPDTPARAFRDAAGTVRLIATHHANRAFSGPTLDALTPECEVLLASDRIDDPAARDDLTWLASTYTLDGETVYALAHHEYLGHLRPGRCTGTSYQACWSNAVTFAWSTDGGRRFRQPPEHHVAAPPYRYRGDLGRRTGYFNPSNIIARGGWYYVMLFAEAEGAQARGTCLLRTRDLADPGGWRAWDGRGFGVRFADPYRETVAQPERHVCAPVAPPQLGNLVTSLTRHEASGLYIALFAGYRAPQPGRAQVTGVFAATSPDLLRWSAPQLVWQAPILWRFGCDEGAPVFYPALLDPDTASRNFESVDDRGFIYFTSVNLSNCSVSWDRDLMRLEVAISTPEARATEAP
jgi:hypothetical protein